MSRPGKNQLNLIWVDARSNQFEWMKDLIEYLHISDWTDFPKVHLNFFLNYWTAQIIHAVHRVCSSFNRYIPCWLNPVGTNSGVHKIICLFLLDNILNQFLHNTSSMLASNSITRIIGNSISAEISESPMIYGDNF